MASKQLEEMKNRDYSSFGHKDVAKVIAEKESRIRELEEALRELVELKRLKDSQGKTEDYLQRQPAAWLNAFHILHKK